MAYLVRRPGTHILRLILFPVALTSLIRLGFHITIPGGEYAAYNVLKSYVCLVVLSKAVDYAFYAGGIHKSVHGPPRQVGGTPAGDGEMTPSAVSAVRNHHTNNTHLEKKSPNPVSEPSENAVTESAAAGFFAPVLEALEILCAARGLEFDYGRGMTIPPDPRPPETRPFLWATFKHWVSRLLIIDAIDTMWKHASPFGTPKGGSIFIQTLPWHTRYLMSTLYHLSTGMMIICMFEVMYDLATLVGVGILSQPPKAWPPIFWNPFESQCLQEFWSVRWQQVLRRTFFVYGGLLGGWISKRLGLRRGVGLVFGTFIASGFYHEIPLYAHARTWDWRMLQFFVAQGFFVVLERTWEKVTGRPVQGLLGQVWVAVTVAGVGQSTFSDILHLRGIGGSMIIPTMLSPTRMLFLPFLSYVIDTGTWLNFSGLEGYS
ncbi:hypothetical protein BU17DRAFT_45689 [Hysterangium stoloniferum]|nr:hypothetical protein BU17DRAFT_45689 [Hysterangium stoloniferum]